MIPDPHRMKGGAAQLGACPGLSGPFGTWSEEADDLEPSQPAPAPQASPKRRAEIAEAFDLPPDLMKKNTDAAAPLGTARADEPATSGRRAVVGVTMMVQPQLPPEVEAFYEGAAGEHLARQADAGGSRLVTAPERIHDQLMKWVLAWDATGSPRHVMVPCPQGEAPDTRVVVWEALAEPRQ
ncbi:hypothetical protein [Streptomyces sp. NPDC001750]|uniref:hypothetical protein n=1 Tax=Streptomyces sp. NPDC001750 TaxID=3364607 RepID=UPI003695120E